MSPVRPRPTPPRVDVRCAFTLIELLVAMGIFLILTVIAIGSFRGVNKDDRISAGAQQVKGWFEHARSMAIHDQQPRGIRLLPDANNPRFCTSVAYIGGVGFDETDTGVPLAVAGGITERKIVGVSLNGLLIRPFAVDSSDAPIIGSNVTAADWTALIENGSLSTITAQNHGLRIEVPRGSGHWYPVQGVDTGSPPFLLLGQPVRNFAQYIGQALDYRLELGPTVLPDTANPLPRGVVIDLDASALPDSWRPVMWPATSSPPAPYGGQMDIMFSPRGAFAGQFAARTGMIHFVVSTVEDAEQLRVQVNEHPANVTASTVPPAPYLPYPFVMADPLTSQRIVSAFLTSGRIASSEVFIDPGDDADPSQWQNNRAGSAFGDASRPFRYAIRGREAK
ncbi:MAG: prepilin-type N-terminal cleavage/methylation domain-containing protein [Planctomyces sp.]|nr:prepilin-type N-terminal cleavage/methylation domain-containing protein [Planctomyces sp.]